jgi:glycosyltransferase involved in cell wall biosynthesis
MTHRLAVVASHVIQYQDPFFRQLAADPEIDLTVLYGSRHGAETYRDEDMGTSVQWDVPMLEGYHHRFLRNLARDPNAGYTRLVNPGIVPALVRGHYDAVIFMLGWGSVTALLGIITCWFTRTPFFLFGDSSFPPPETTLRARVRAGLLRILFGLTTGFMVSGELNARYYRHYGAAEETFFLLPWAIDNERFVRESRLSADERAALRARFGVGNDDVLILYSAKLVPRKDPMTLLHAFERMQLRDRAVLLFLGDGILRELLEEYVRTHGLHDRVRFAGFVNQKELPRHYAIADLFVLPSSYEPRGAVLNEAMACGLPVVVTDRCGSIGDIVQENTNAFVYPAGDAAALAAILDRLTGDATLRQTMGAESRAIIDTWDYARGVAGVKRMLAWVAAR